MFGPAAAWYVYLCYGVHEMLNLTTGPIGYPAAILIRGLNGVIGPGRLTKRLGIDRRFNGLVASRETGLWLEDNGIPVADTEVEQTARIGVDYAGPDWANRPYRYVWATRDSGSPYLVKATTESPFKSNDSSLARCRADRGFHIQSERDSPVIFGNPNGHFPPREKCGFEEKRKSVRFDRLRFRQT